MGKMDPWISEFKEIIDLAVTLFDSGLESGSRIAIVLLDNCVEFMYKAYLRIKKQAVGTKANQIKPNEWESTVSRYFNHLANAMKQRGPSTLKDEIIEDSIHYHQIRNDLYHSDTPLKTADKIYKEQLDLVLKILKILFNTQYKPSNKLDLTSKPKSASTISTMKGREERLQDSIDNARAAVADLWTKTSTGWHLENVGRASDRVALSLLESYPSAKRVTEIAKECRVAPPTVTNIVTGTRGEAKYFEKVRSGQYRLSIEGINWVIRIVVPNIGRA